MSVAYGERVNVAVVTGAAGGIGLAICKRLIEEEVAHIILVDRSSSVATVAKELGRHATGLVADCSQESEIARVVNEVEGRYGSIDLFVANAGIMTIGDLDVLPEVWEKMWKINVMHIVWAAKYVIPGMISRGRGDFVVTASAAGLLTQLGSLPYATTKHAAVAVAEWLYITYGTKGIRVSCLCPQGVNTDMVKGFENHVASVDGLIEPSFVANELVKNLVSSNPTFLVLPHQNVAKYIARKGADPERWIKGMQQLNAQFAKLVHKL